MGQKVHPYGFRLGTLYGWQSNWFADKHYAAQLHEDIAVRSFIKKKLFHAGISKIVIDRTGEKLVINIHTARPGILIGKRGAEVDTLRQELKAYTDKDVFINVKEIRKAEAELRREFGRLPTREEISRHLNRSLARIDRVLQHGAREISLDAPVGEEQDRPLADVLEDDREETVEQNMLDDEMKRGVGEIFEQLNQQQRAVIAYRFGLDGEPPLTLQETGERMDLSRERVRQIECQAKERMRKLFVIRMKPRRRMRPTMAAARREEQLAELAH